MSYPGGPLQKTKSPGKFKRYHHMRFNTVAKKSARRKARGTRGAWLRRMPNLTTDKASTRNNGRAPRFSTAPYVR